MKTKARGVTMLPEGHGNYLQVPGRGLGHDLGKKTLGFQHAMPRELLNGTLQKTNTDPFKKDKAERRKRPANSSARAAGE